MEGAPVRGPLAHLLPPLHLGVGGHPAGAGDAEGQAAQAGVGRLGPAPPPEAETWGLGVSRHVEAQARVGRLGPAPPQAQARRLGVSCHAEAQARVGRLGDLVDVLECYAGTGEGAVGFTTQFTWHISAGVFLLRVLLVIIVTAVLPPA